ncbi:hypothetical protein GCM10027280_12180 [Micromonospora polyrhachis]|uniref:Membrane protein DedA with SNARE-associated domain n=1 Tax=Micromonospora polyrhachis TaxID=1282883 RepID=A0A7W7SS57_9ACTN|nr:DedA family protein [Micromonospora polyrhachis]MBB4959953.1 membrane protein DedA with SNARE-associated domain [Micromonospora polyrhachis]
MSEFLTGMTSPLWAYLALVGLLAIDVFVPIIPTQALMITGGALTIYGGLSLPVTIVTGALGVFAGDLAGYLLGRRGHRRRREQAERRRMTNRAPLSQSNRGRQAANRARQLANRYGHHLRQPGPLVILLCRFVPGGRMLVCYHAGRGHYPYRRFLTYEAMAAVGWAAYGGLVGHLGGSALAGSGWLLALIAGAAAAVFAAGGWALALVAGRRPAAVASVPTAAGVPSAPAGPTILPAAPSTILPAAPVVTPARATSAVAPPR